MVIILAVDPGGTTGWVRVSFELESHTVLLDRWGTFDNIEDEVDSTRLMYHHADYAVAESYIIRPDTAQVNIGLDLNAVKVLGRVELWAHHYGVELHLQTPSQAKQQWGNRRLKKHFPRHDLKPGGMPGVKPGRLCAHQCDALRHAMTFIENHFNVALVITDPEDVI